MILVATSNALPSLVRAVHCMQAGGSAVDAVETAIRWVEANPDDLSVGYGGWPNLLGQVELDAGIMEGRERTAGAVGALRGFKYPISVSRQVLEKLPHVLLVGDGAARFAQEVGAERCELLTSQGKQFWEERMGCTLDDESRQQIARRSDLWQHNQLTRDPDRTGGTVNVIALDPWGSICAGASTSGWPLKYPGRLGDSCIVGAGFYADNRYGAAACTGMGEMAMRALAAYSAVAHLKQGSSVTEAGRRAMEDLVHLGGPYRRHISLLVVDQAGRHAGFSTVPGEVYAVMTPELTEAAAMDRIHVPIELKWNPRQEGRADDC